MNELKHIKMEALGIPIGQSKTVHCCFCDNDPPYAPTLSITRTDDGILYNCFRAACSGSGFIGSLPTSEMVTRGGIGPDPDRFIPRPYTEPTQAANPTDLHERWGLTPEEVANNGIVELPHSPAEYPYRWLFPLFDEQGYCFGHTTKILNSEQ